jgi:tetratricopeptide (TPR) repeat protein
MADDHSKDHEASQAVPQPEPTAAEPSTEPGPEPAPVPAPEAEGAIDVELEGGEELEAEEAEEEEPPRPPAPPPRERTRWLDSLLKRLDDDKQQGLTLSSSVAPDEPEPAPAPEPRSGDDEIAEIDDISELDGLQVEEASASPPVPPAEAIPPPVPAVPLPEPGAEAGVEVEAAAPPDEGVAGDEPAAVPAGEAPEPEEAEEPERAPLEEAVAAAIQDDPNRLESALQQELDAEEERSRKAVIQHELGHLVHERLRSESKAVKAYAQALNYDPLLRPNVWAVRRVFVARQLWANLLKLHDAEVRFEEDPARKAEVLLEKGWIIHDRLGDAAAAREALDAAHAAHPSWLAPLLALERIALEGGDVAELAEVYRRMAEATLDPARKVAILVDLARLQDRLSDGTPQRALELLEQAVAIGHDRDWVLALMERTAGAAGLHRQLCTILEREARAALERPEPQRALAAARYRLAAQVAEEQLDDLPEAIRFQSAAHEQLPDDRVIRSDLLRLAERGEDWARVEALLGRQLELAEDAASRAVVHHQIAQARTAGGAPTAFEALQRALDAVPGYLPVLVEQERSCLERGDLEGLTEVWLREAEAVRERSPGLPLADGEGASWAAEAIWRAASVLHRELRQYDRALELCRRALQIDPACTPALDELEEILQRIGRYGELAALLEERSASGDRALLDARLETLCALCAGSLDDPERLLSTLRRLRELRPEDRRVLRRFAEVLERAGLHEELDAALRALEEGEEDDERLTSLKLSRARLHEGPLGKPATAVTIYWEILERRPDHPFAFAALEAVLRRQGDHAALARLLRQTADQCAPGPEGQARKAELLRALGVVHERRLGDPAQAVAVYSELLALTPGAPDALHALARAARDASEPSKLAEALESLAADGDPAARARTLLRLAETLELELSDASRAEEVATRALELWPDHGGALVDLHELLARRQLARSDHADAAQSFAQLQRHAPDAARTALLEEQAWIATGPLRDPARGAELWLEVAKADPQNPRAPLAQLRLAARQRDSVAVAAISAELASRAQDPAIANAFDLRAGSLAGSSATDAYRRALQRQPGQLEAVTGLLARGDLPREERSALLLELAKLAPERAREELRLPLAIACERSGRASAAFEELRSLLEKDPDNLAALTVLQRIAEALADREREARCWVRIGTLATDRVAKTEAFTRAAELLEALGRGADAAILFRQVLALKPTDPAAHDRLRAIYERDGDHKGLDEVMGHRILHVEDKGTLIGLHFERSALRLGPLGDRPGAVRDLLRILQLEPRHLEALRQLSKLYDEDGNSSRALELYRRYVEVAETAQVKRPAVLRMAELNMAAGRSAEAVDVCRAFLELASDDERVLELLVELYLQLRDFPHAISMLERLSELRSDRSWKADIHRRIAGIYSRELRDLPEARATLLRARDLNPTHLEIIRDLRQICLQLDAHEELEAVLERAKDDLREALQASPVDVSLYQRLMQVAEWREDTYTLLATMGVLCYLEAADAEDRELYQRRIAKVTFVPKHQLSSQAWREALLDRGARNAYGELWAVIADIVPKLFEGRVPGDPSAFGVGRSERVDRKAGSPVSTTLDRIAAALGLSDFEIFLSARDPEVVAGVVGERPSLIVGSNVVTGLDGLRRFRIGRVLSLLRDRAFALELVDRDALELLFAAVVFTVEPGASFTRPRGEVEAEARRIAKLLPRKAKRALPLAVTRFMQEGGVLEQWIDGVIATANRAGLLVSGDILAAMGDLVDLGGRKSSEEIGALVLERRHAAQLLTFSVGREYLALRKDLQL